MPKDKLGNKQTIVLHIRLFRNKRYDLVITLYRQKSRIHWIEKTNKREGCNNKLVRLLVRLFQFVQEYLGICLLYLVSEWVALLARYF